MSKRILIVEDEKNLARFVSLELQHEGYDVVTADNGREGLEMALEKDFDLILLDLMLPEMDGFEVTRRLQQEKDTYIMMMTARDSIMDIVAGLDRGADDYIVKPFEFPELLARIRSVLRRHNKSYQSNIIHFNNGITIDRVKFTAYSNGQDLLLTRREFQLLDLLLQNEGTTLPREQIIGSIWDSADGISSNALDALIKLLRRKMIDAGRKDIIKTVHGIGYKIEE